MNSLAKNTKEIKFILELHRIFKISGGYVSRKISLQPRSGRRDKEYVKNKLAII
jgi:hypothetical protein